MNDLFSTRMGRINTSEIRRVFQLAAQLKDPINLSIGQPHFATPEPIVAAIERAMRDGHTAYTETQGILPLRERISRKFRDVNGIATEPDRVLISAGVAPLIQLLLMSTIDPGDRVLITDPCFLIYRSLLDFFGARVATIRENLTEQDIESAKKGGPYKLIIFCTPSNPSGHIMSREQLEWLGELAESTGALLVSDEIYEVFDYDSRFVSAASVYDKTITLMGFSKSYAMTGLRLSAATGPEAVIKAMTTLQQYTIVCAPAPVQYGGIAALDLNMNDYVESYRNNRDRCVAQLQGVTEFMFPQGAFYLFAQVPGEDRDFVERAINEKQLLVVPGRIFTEQTNWIRISYATDEGTLDRGLDSLRSLLSGP